ncbi:MAG: hypothetical protein ACYTFI_24865, partial [Planctomycetota bacterium]
MPGVEREQWQRVLTESKSGTYSQTGKEQDMNAQENDRRKQRAGPWMLVLLPYVMAIFPAAARDPSGYYTEPQIYGMRPNPRGELDLGPIGATGIEARIYKGLKVTVEDTQPGTPAH